MCKIFSFHSNIINLYLFILILFIFIFPEEIIILLYFNKHLITFLKNITII